MPDTSARQSRSRLHVGRRRAARPEPAAAPAVSIPLEDLAAATGLAQEAASPFGYLRPARELLAQFGAADDAVARADAALAAVGIAADPPLATVSPARLVRLRPADVRVIPEPLAPAPEPLAPEPEPLAPAPEPLAVAPEPAAAPLDEPAAEPEPKPKRTSWAQRTAARHAPTAPVTRERQLLVAALGFAALVVFIAAVVFLRSVTG